MAIFCSALSGTLQRHDDGSWRWSDGTIEPRAHDLNRDATYNFRCRTTANGTAVEVLRQRAENEPDLGWVLAGHAAGAYTLDTSGDHTGPLVIDEDGQQRLPIRPGEDPLEDVTVPDRRDVPIPSVILVPIADWDAWVRSAPPIGVEWHVRDDAEILGRARSLGWQG